MKSLLRLSFLTIAVGALLASCTIEKRVHLPGYHVEWKTKDKPNEHVTVDNGNDKQNDPIEGTPKSSTRLTPVDNTSEPDGPSASASVGNSIFSLAPTSSLSTAFSTPNPPKECDTITLKNGVVLSGKVIEITPTEIKYKKCANLDGPMYIISKSNVLTIVYPNGTKDTFAKSVPSTIANSEPATSTQPKTEGFGIAGFLTSLIGIVVAAIPLGIVSVIFGAISLGRISRQPERYKGKGFGITAIILGIIEIIIGLLILVVLI